MMMKELTLGGRESLRVAFGNLSLTQACVRKVDLWHRQTALLLVWRARINHAECN